MYRDRNDGLLEAYFKVFEHDWVNQNSPADTNGPTGDTKTVALCSHSAGEDLRRSLSEGKISRVSLKNGNSTCAASQPAYRLQHY
jgi:hypothetical protein